MKKPLFIAGLGLLLTISCNKDNIAPEVVKALHETYPDYEIEECKWNKEAVFTVKLDALDAPKLIFNASNEKIGTCDYFVNMVDDICYELANCKVVYRPKDSVTGLPAVDKYNLD